MDPKTMLILGLAGFVVALGTQLASLEHGWADATSTTFVGALLGQVGSLLIAVFGAKQMPPDPRDPLMRTRRSDSSSSKGVA